MMKKLNEYNLTADLDVIKNKTKKEWKELVRKATLEKNKGKLIENCTSQTPEGQKIHTKTRYIYEMMTKSNYDGKTPTEIINHSKQHTKTIVLARNGMLECGKNFRGTIKEICPTCNITDDENHRLNTCKKWQSIDDSSEKNANFNDIYSNNEDILDQIISEIEKVWELQYANGRMKKT